MGYPNHQNQSYGYSPGQHSQPLLSAGSSTTLAMLCHLSTFLGVSLLPVAGFVVGPLIVWLTQKDDPFIDHHGREAINFQLNMLIWYGVSLVLCLALVGFFMLPAVALYSVVMTIIASVKAASGEHYRYPLILRFF